MAITAQMLACRMVHRVTWRLAADDVDVASVRYRCLTPLRVLEDRDGASHELSWGSHDPLSGDPDAVVFVKAFGDADVEHARRAAARGVRVVADVCDNFFVGGKRSAAADNLRALAAVAAMVTTTGPTLAEVLRKELVGAEVHEIPDPAERQDDVRWAVRRLYRERMRMARHAPGLVLRGLPRAARGELRALDRRHSKACTHKSVPIVLWFGNTGSANPRFGMLNLADIGDELVAAARETPYELRVLSGSRSAYQQLVEPLALQTTFFPWQRFAVYRELRRASLVVIPNSRDAFSECKSANRGVMALSHRVPVVATSIPAFEPLIGCFLGERFAQGIPRYLRDADLRHHHVRRAQDVIRRNYAPTVIAGAWTRAIGIGR